MFNLMRPNSSRSRAVVSNARVNRNAVSSSSSNQRSNVLYDNYELGRKLGKGGNGKVYEARCKFTNMTFACKVLDKQKQKQEKVYREIKLLRELNHENIVSFHEYYENQRNIFIVMQHAKGGELFHALRKHGKFQEHSAREVISALLKACTYLHEKGIVHRDIKLENILLLNEMRSSVPRGEPIIKKSDVVLVDFGLAKCLKDHSNRTFSYCGSPYYTAPEVLLGNGYGLQVDLWGIGVVMYMLMTDTPPFFQTRDTKLIEAIVSARYTLDGEAFRNTSAEAKDLLRKLLTLNPARRITAHKACHHAWFRQ